MVNHLKSSDPEWTIVKLLEWTTSYFKSHNIDSPRATAEILLAHILKIERIDLYLRYDQPLNSSELVRFKALIKRRLNREPVAYITGSKEFWSFNFAVTKDVLIPRPETECLVEAALALLSAAPNYNSKFKTKRVLELGTGSGAVIIALALQQPEHCYFASDCSVDAVALARKNAGRHGFDRKICFFCGDWLTPLAPGGIRFDMIISNPPYIETHVLGRLQPEIFEYEPMTALDGGPDGLCCLKLIIEDAHHFLKAHGSLLLEIGHDQKTKVAEIIAACGQYEDVVFRKDYSGYDRVVQMRKKS